MLDSLIFFKTVLETLTRLRRPLGRSLTQPTITAMLLTALYGGYHVVHEASFPDGLRVAFFETNAGRATRLREREDAILQAELRQLAASNKVIDGLLESLLEHAPTAARTRLDVIHNGVTGLTGMGLLRYDVTNSIASAGHAPGPLVQNRPLAEWGDFLDDLLAGECRMSIAGGLRNPVIRARLEMLNVGTVLVCPASDGRGRLQGAVFALWDVGTQLPEGAELTALMNRGKQIGTQIATVLDLRLPPSQPPR